MKKDATLTNWRAMPDRQPILKHFHPIPYKATGSRYGACGIRIDGTPEFIDAVLSRLKELIDGENHVTRLELARNTVDGSKLGKAFSNSTKDSECCYVRLHMRGGQGAAASAFFDRHLAEPTRRFAEAIGVDV